MNRPDGILLDLDDTLTDRGASVRAFADRLVTAFGPRLADADVDTVFEAIRAADDNGYAPRRAVASALRDRISWADAPSAGELLDFWWETFADCAVARAGASDALAELRSIGLRLAIVSNGSRDASRRKVRAAGYADAVDAVVISGEVGVAKPERGIYAIALSRLGLPASATWFVGDHPVNDVAGPRAMGMATVWLRGHFPWPEELAGPDRTISEFSELPPLAATAEHG